jgi:hypothetical protein
MIEADVQIYILEHRVKLWFFDDTNRKCRHEFSPSTKLQKMPPRGCFRDEICFASFARK